MSLRRSPTCAAIAAALCIASVAHAQNPAGSSDHPSATADQRYRYRFLGVYDETTGDPIEGVEISDVLSGNKSLTTATGTVSLLFLPDGGSLVRIRKVGYEVQTLPIAIAPTETNPVTVILKRAVTLPTVEVKDSAQNYSTALLRNAVARMNSHSGGYFINEVEMRKHDESTMSNTLVGRLPGVTTIIGPHGEVWIRSSRVPCLHPTIKGGCNVPDCFVSVYRDGVKIFDPVISGAAQRVDFSRMSPAEIAIAEYYPGGSTVPPEYGGLNAPCGVLLLWTRDR